MPRGAEAPGTARQLVRGPGQPVRSPGIGRFAVPRQAEVAGVLRATGAPARVRQLPLSSLRGGTRGMASECRRRPQPKEPD